MISVLSFGYLYWSSIFHNPDLKWNIVKQCTMCVTDGLMQEMHLFNVTCQWWGIFFSVKPANIVGSMVFFCCCWNWTVFGILVLFVFMSQCASSVLLCCIFLTLPYLFLMSLSLHPISIPFHMTFSKFLDFKHSFAIFIRTANILTITQNWHRYQCVVILYLVFDFTLGV